MAEYIEKGALYNKIAELEDLARQRVIDTPTNSPAYPRYVAQLNEREYLKSRSLAMPAADVVPVVRCRDCKHYVKGSCNAHSVWPDECSTGYDCRPDDDDFCSYGERKED